MRVIIVSGKAVELNYMWLPTWLGENLQFKKDLETRFRSEVEGQGLTEVFLDDLHNKIIDYIVKKYPIPGLFDYLDGIKFVEI